VFRGHHTQFRRAGVPGRSYSIPQGGVGVPGTPAPLAGEGGIDGLEFREGKDGAASHQPDLPLLQVAALRDNDQVALISPDFVRLTHDRESRAEDRYPAAGQVISLTKLPLVDLEPERFHRYELSSSSGYGSGWSRAPRRNWTRSFWLHRGGTAT